MYICETVMGVSDILVLRRFLEEGVFGTEELGFRGFFLEKFLTVFRILLIVMIFVYEYIFL